MPGRAERVLVKVNRAEELLEELRQLVSLYARQHFQPIPARFIVQPDEADGGTPSDTSDRFRVGGTSRSPPAATRPRST